MNQKTQDLRSPKSTLPGHLFHYLLKTREVSRILSVFCNWYIPPDETISTRAGSALLLLVAAVQTHAITITFLPPSSAHHPSVQGSSGVPLIVPADADVVGAPTISAAFINQVLISYHSPAVGTGQALYDLGKASGIDPVFALAFFQHESMFGTLGWARANRSLGNIRCEPQYPCNGGYARYSSWVEGYRDWYRLIHDLSSGPCHLTTVRTIIHSIRK